MKYISLIPEDSVRAYQSSDLCRNRKYERKMRHNTSLFYEAYFNRTAGNKRIETDKEFYDSSLLELNRYSLPHALCSQIRELRTYYHWLQNVFDIG